MNYIMRYKQPAEDSAYGWEHQSLPIGNGYMGGNVFGIVERDRIQITENALQNPGSLGGLNNFAELYLHFPHKEVENYERGLNLNEGVAYTRYTVDGVQYEREYFTSYPDKVLAIHLSASAPFSTRVELVIPYIKDYAINEGDGGGKSGSVSYEGNRAILLGTMNYYNIHFAGELAVLTDGAVESGEDGIAITDATDVVVYMTIGTNYELRPEVFLEDDPKKKLRDFDPDDRVAEMLEDVLAQDFAAIREKHLADHGGLFGRVDLELGEELSDPTDVLLARYAKGEAIPYLEMVYFQFGRYMLIASSRKGTLPANLQGVWNVHDQSPWGSGYWHNINVQMNYWPAFVTNLAETFTAYADFNAAFRAKAEVLAEEYIKKYDPECYEEGACGWTIGTASYPYTISAPGGHSGPGTGGLTSKLFWDYYDFTRDHEVLEKVAYPALRGMSEFLTKTVRDFGDGEYRAVFSASPEQMLNRLYVSRGRYHQTVGCAFDQQMIYENGRDYLEAASLLGYTDDPLFDVQQEQIDHYHPVRIGWSGQIKEYEEENMYGEIGEYHHRHISELIGLQPGTVINHTTPAWMDAAKYTLTERGDEATGWALAHRLNAWARTDDGEHAYTIVRNLIGTRTMDNLWDFHPPYQIDGNFGGTSGIAEMLLQSHEGYIAILPTIPKAWAKRGHFKGLVARGAFDVEVSWADGTATEIIITSKVGGECAVSYPCIEMASLDGAMVTTMEKDLIAFDTEAGQSYRITEIPVCVRTEMPADFAVDRDTLALSWKAEEGVTYRVYRSMGDAPDYELLTEVVDGGSYQDTLDWAKEPYVMYKLTAQKEEEEESMGAVVTINHADELYLTRYKHWLADTTLGK